MVWGMSGAEPGRALIAGTGESLEVETQPQSSVSSPADADTSEKLLKRQSRWPAVSEAAVFLLFSVFFLAYGLTPLLGGYGLGLVGADEPRYAQIAHEMLGRFDSAHTLADRLSACVTPYLYGKPWLEKPALYYWRGRVSLHGFWRSHW